MQDDLQLLAMSSEGFLAPVPSSPGLTFAATPLHHANTNITINTASSLENPDGLSPRALEKRRAQDFEPAGRNLPLRPEQAQTAVDNASTLEEQLLPRRSFLDSFRSRSAQKNTGIPRDSRPAASRLLNPINYLPRPTSLQVEKSGYSSATQTVPLAGRETRTLLTLPEQRRSRQNSPNSPIVTDPSSNRSSIGLPPNRSSRNLELTKSKEMGDSEKPAQPEQEPEKVHIPVSKYNFSDRDVEANIPSTQSILGQSYGVTKEDHPAHPARRVTSIHSLRQHKSTISLRSVTYSYNGQSNYPPPSRAGTTRGELEDNNDQGSMSEELAWGPAHPCYPHLNTHVPLDSTEYADSRIIRIRRDWMVKGDLAPTFSNLYPEILDPLISEQEFRHIVQHVNKTLVEAFDPFATSSWLDGFLGVATGWLWEDLRPGGVKGKLKGLEKWISEWNRNVGAREGVSIIPLRRTGYMSLDFQIPDPQVRVVGDKDTTMPPPTTVDGSQY